MPSWSAPVRACLAGEDLDWIGGLSVCVAVALPTTVGTDAPVTVDPRLSPWQTRAWRALGLGADGSQPPAVRVSSAAPVASGLATSSSLLMVLLAAYSDMARVGMSSSRLIELAFRCEREVANGGGMDHLAIGLGGPC